MPTLTTYLYRVGQTAVQVANPSMPLTKRRLSNSTSRRALDGTLVTQRSTAKWSWDVQWSGLDPAEYSTLMAELERDEPMTWIPPEGSTSYTVHVVGDIQTEPQTPDTLYWTVSATFEEQ